MELADLGKIPITEANPSGSDARYEDEYAGLQQQIDRLSSATSEGGIDWTQVVSYATTLLSQKTKDIKVASYLGVALIHLKGVEGLSLGAQILLDLVTTFWDTLYPEKKRMRGRIGAITWWQEAAEQFVRAYDGDAQEQTSVDLLVQRLRELESNLARRCDEAPLFNSLIGYANSLPVIATAPPAAVPLAQPDNFSDTPATSSSSPDYKASPIPVSSQGASQPTSGAKATSTSFNQEVLAGPITSPDVCQTVLKAGLAGISAAAEYLLATNGADWTGYQMRRIACWTPVVILPPAVEGKTMIPPPDGTEKEAIVRQLQGRDYVGALQASESRLGQYLFWLDLSRLASEALEGLGADYSIAKLALETEISLFIRRLPGVESMSFSDGTPFADAKTRGWLKSLNRDASAGMADTPDAGMASAQIFRQAVALAKNNNVLEAVSVLQNSLSSTTSGRERFCLRIGMIQLLADVGQSALAHAHVEEVLEHIEEFRLEDWEPDLALHGFQAAYEALITEDREDARSLAQKALRRISRISPAAALKINGMQ